MQIQLKSLLQELFSGSHNVSAVEHWGEDLIIWYLDGKMSLLVTTPSQHSKCEISNAQDASLCLEAYSFLFRFERWKVRSAIDVVWYFSVAASGTTFP